MAGKAPKHSHPITPWDAIRLPPQAVEAEQAVLGGLMLVPDAWDSVADLLVEDDFYRREHRLIFRAIGELVGSGQPPDAVTLGEWFERNGEAATIGGAAYLAELANTTPSAANISAYATIVRDKSVLRQLIEASTQIAGESFNPAGRTTQEILDGAEEQVFRIAELGAKGRRPVISVTDGLKEAMGILAVRAANPGQLSGLPTGFTDLDRLMSGMQRQDLIVVAGRPSMGKTSLAMNIAEYVVLRAKQPVLMFSMEMSAPQLVLRMIASVGRVDQAGLRSGDLPEEEWSKVAQANAIMLGAPLYIDATPGLSPGEVRSRARRIRREHGLGMVIVDYLQLMQVPGNKENRATEVADISRSLKAMAKELDVPVLALSQLNRGLEQRNDKRPVMSDLRESGAIEQDADVILFVYRDEVYNKESNHKGIAEIIIGKQRNGPIDTIKLTFLGQYTKFENYAPEAYLDTYR